MRIIDWKVLKTMQPYSRQQIQRLENDGRLPNFLVLHVTTSELRLNNLSEIGRKHLHGSDCSYLLFKAMPSSATNSVETSKLAFSMAGSG